MSDVVTGSTTTAPGFVLPVPGAADVRRALQRHFSPERTTAIWEGACLAAGLTPDAASIPPEQLARVADALTRQDGVTRVVGRSLSIRIATYLVLRQRAVAMPSVARRDVAANARAAADARTPVSR